MTTDKFKYVLDVNLNDEHKKTAIAMLDEELGLLVRYVGNMVKDGVKSVVLIYMSAGIDHDDIKTIWVSDSLQFDNLRKVEHVKLDRGLISFNLTRERGCGFFSKDVSLFLFDYAVDLIKDKKHITLKYEDS